ncbi:MAG: cell wall synthase accessory phosphoprotein MacP [Streptococcaceae bacterium]|jgi:Flp pilus assembly protein TadB|nr:cell wall synthase accessory phosphoprotein MacP [Streptococcaceae bacterium]
MARNPLLTDEIVDKAKREREQLEEDIRRGMQEDTRLVRKYDEIERKQQKQAVYKSRRIENVKTKQRGKKLNRYLVILIIILLLMIAWILSPWS